ncbi:MAG: amidase [Ilumatobacter sp.]|nr:MAG: amidase [Ilumatobacter sp.]
MDNELHWRSGTELAAAIRAKEVSSREVLDHLVERIDRLDGPVNSVVHWDLERARATATAADEAVARGDELGALHGVPMTIKDSFQTEGCITTSGAPELAEHVPTEDAWPVARLRDAGAVVFAKTNLPIYAGDIQSYNDVYGTTNNPHDVTRGPGGSSGGSAAALAMGFTPIELGSDIGGSIRVPAHYSGVMGHKPSFGIVPAHGQIPGPPGTLSQADLAVAGPLARTVDDLETELHVLAGPDRWNTPAWRLDLPPSRATELADFRIAAWLDDEHCPVDADTARVLGETVTAIEGAGGRVDTDARPGFTLAKVDDVFQNLLMMALSGGHERSKIERMAEATGDEPMAFVKRATASRHRDWLSYHERRMQIRERWAEFFGDFDAIVLPVHPRPAIPHDHHEPMWDRMVDIGGESKPYGHLFRWTGPAGAAYLPATVVPVGMSADGLPIGVQIVGPYLHDLTTLRLAALVAELMGGCPRPALSAGR